MHIVKKRLICKMFKDGKSVFYIAGCAGFIMYTVTEIEDVIRDAMNKKFVVEPNTTLNAIRKWNKKAAEQINQEPKKRRKA